MPNRPLIAGNWKMNGLHAALGELRALAQEAPRLSGVDVLVCPPATVLAAAHEIAGNAFGVGGQTCHLAESGAHTGEISAEMLADCGASHVIVGHSERRSDCGESDADVAARAKAAWRAGLVAIVCIGETEEQRDAGRTLDVLKDQLAGSVPEGATAANTIVAYEPVWAIGTGRTPTLAEVGEAHAFMRRALTDRFGADADAIRLLYGGSVKPSNAGELLAVADVDGALVGGASLKAADLVAICRSAMAG